MSARSSLLFLLLGGCDLAFGVGGDPDPCELGSFDKAKATDIAPAFAFSVDWDQQFAVVIDNDGMSFEQPLPAGTPALIDLGPYNHVTLSLAPEGTALLYTSSTEPMLLQGALRASPATWKLDARVPAATFTGTPSADVFGPRRMLARLHELDYNDAGQPIVQELEDRDGTWIPLGTAHVLDSQYPPNLTPDGLTAVFTASTVADDNSVRYDIYGMTRPSVDVWFDAPVKILSNGNDQNPQLLGHCDRLYTVHDGSLRRYDR